MANSYLVNQVLCEGDYFCGATASQILNKAFYDHNSYTATLVAVIEIKLLAAEYGRAE